METKTLSNRTFSNKSFEHWQSKRCDFCMYHEIIFDQLQKLKEAVIIKNQRIAELQLFISRLSQMAFNKTPMTQSTNNNTNFISPQINESSLQFHNDQLSTNQKVINPAYFKKKFQESSEISFSDSRHNTAKFQTRIKENWPDMNSRLQKINELNEIKKEMSRKIIDASAKNQRKDSHREQSLVNSLTTNQYDTLRSLSIPQEEGHINSIADCSRENSRVKELSQRNNKFNELQEGQGSNCGKWHSSKDLEEESKSSLSIIKEYIKRLK